MKLKGKTALITGGTRGIGEALARRFSAEGANVAILGRSKERGNEVAKSINGAGGKAIFVQADVSVESEVRHAVETTERTYGSVHILVNNAMATDMMSETSRPLDQNTLKEFDAMVKVGLYGTFLASKYCLPLMMKGGSGSVINVSSVAGVVGFVGIPAYSATKAAIQGLSRSIAADYGQHGIRSNTIVLGVIHNGLTEALWSNSAMREAMFKIQMLPREGTESDIANLALFLASDESIYMTAQEIRVDGGLSNKGLIAMDMIETATAAGAS